MHLLNGLFFKRRDLSSIAMTHSDHSLELSKWALGINKKALIRIKSIIFGSNCFFLCPETFELICTSGQNNHHVIKTAPCFFWNNFSLKFLLTDRESRSSADDFSRDDKDETPAEVDGPCTTCESCLPKD